MKIKTCPCLRAYPPIPLLLLKARHQTFTWIFKFFCTTVIPMFYPTQHTIPDQEQQRQPSSPHFFGPGRLLHFFIPCIEVCTCHPSQQRRPPCGLPCGHARLLAQHRMCWPALREVQNCDQVVFQGSAGLDYESQMSLSVKNPGQGP